MTVLSFICFVILLRMIFVFPALLEQIKRLLSNTVLSTFSSTFCCASSPIFMGVSMGIISSSSFEGNFVTVDFKEGIVPL